MKHLNQEQFLEWIETGHANSGSRLHIDTCKHCASELASLRAVFQQLTTDDSTPEMDALMSERFRQDLSRKVRLLPEPVPRRFSWGFLGRAVFGKYSVLAAVATIVMVFAVFAIYKYDKIDLPVPAEITVSEPAPNPGEAWADSMAVAEAMAKDQTLEPRDFLEVTAASEEGNEALVSVAGEYVDDPFHNLDDLKADELAQLKALLKEKLKG
jgi:hypothetical protein